MADTEMRSPQPNESTYRFAIANTTVIENGDLVALSSGLIIKATATSAKVARAMEAHASGDGTSIECSLGRAKLKMDASDAFAAAHRGGEYDIAVDGDSGAQTINQSGTSYKVLMMSPDENAGTVGSTSDVQVIINKPLDRPADAT